MAEEHHPGDGAGHGSDGSRADLSGAHKTTGPPPIPTISAFSDEVDAGSSQKMRSNKKLERRSDGIVSAL